MQTSSTGKVHSILNTPASVLPSECAFCKMSEGGSSTPYNQNERTN